MIAFRTIIQEEEQIGFEEDLALIEVGVVAGCCALLDISTRSPRDFLLLVDLSNSKRNDVIIPSRRKNFFFLFIKHLERMWEFIWGIHD